MFKFVLFQIPKSADEINLKNVSEMAYVFSGAYTPVLCKLIEQVCSIVLARVGEMFSDCKLDL